MTPDGSSLRETSTVIDVKDHVAGECDTPPSLITDVPLKLFPFRVSVSEPFPPVTSVGEMLTSSGTEFWGSISEVDGSAGSGESPPPGSGFVTRTLNCGGSG